MKKGKEMTVAEYIDELIREEEELSENLFNEAAKLLAIHKSAPGVDHLIREALSEKYPQAGVYPITFAIRDAKEAQSR